MLVLVAGLPAPIGPSWARRLLANADGLSDADRSQRLSRLRTTIHRCIAYAALVTRAGSRLSAQRPMTEIGEGFSPDVRVSNA